MRLGHPAGAEFTAGHLAFVRAHKADAIGTQRGDIALRGGVIPHAHIHRWGNQYLRVCSQQKRRSQIIGQPLRHLGHQISRRRRNYDQISRAGEFDMAHFGFIRQIKEILIDLFLGQSRDRQRSHELAGRARHHRRDPGPCFTQLADQIQRFIGCDASGNNQENAFIVEHLATPSFGVG